VSPAVPAHPVRHVRHLSALCDGKECGDSEGVPDRPVGRAGLLRPGCLACLVMPSTTASTANRSLGTFRLDARARHRSERRRRQSGVDGDRWTV